MIHTLPEELLILIINLACIRPSDYITCRNINQRCYFIVDNLERLYTDKKYNYEKDIQEICLKNTSIQTFNWIFKNDIQRVDVFSLCVLNEYFLKTIFNRFYVHVDEHNDIFSFIETKNPLIIAGINNRIEIIKILLTKKQRRNPYLDLIGDLLDISIKYNHKNLLSYLIIYHYEKIKDSIQRKLNTIIYRISKCESKKPAAYNNTG